MLEALSDNIEGTILSSSIHLCHYFTGCYEDKFISTTGDYGLILSGQIYVIETTSMINDAGVNISQLRVLLRILRYKIGAKLFEPETKMTDICGEMIVP